MTLCEHQNNARWVAPAVLVKPKYSLHSDWRERFTHFYRRSAELLSKLKHKHIVRYLGSHRDDEYFHTANVRTVILDLGIFHLYQSVPCGMYMELVSGGSLEDMMYNSQQCGAEVKLTRTRFHVLIKYQY